MNVGDAERVGKSKRIVEKLAEVVTDEHEPSCDDRAPAQTQDCAQQEPRQLLSLMENETDVDEKEGSQYEAT